jgi:hypothetical protein
MPKIDYTIEAMRDGDNDYDWKEAFRSSSKAIAAPCDESPIVADDFGLDDVEEVLASALQNGSYAEVTVYAVFRLKDGRFACIEASCDTSGWDCQAGGMKTVGRSEVEIVRYGLTNESRAALGYKIEDAAT